MHVCLQHASTNLGINHCSTLGIASGQNGHVRAPLKLLAGCRTPTNKMRESRLLSATENDLIMANTSNAENKIREKPSSTTKPTVSSSAAGNIQPETSDSETTSTRIQETANGSKTASKAKEQTASSNMRPLPKRTALTAREKLRAARVLGRYTEAKPSNSNLGSKVLDAIREGDGGKARSGLPEAPTNLFDDSKRGLPKEGWTFNFPGGNDLLVIIFSFVFISTVMFTTTYIVWKAGAIHFNEY